MNASYIAYRKVGEHRSGKRIWLQGNSLDDAGFSIGDSFTVTIANEDQIVLTINDTGTRKVARKKVTGQDRYLPVVDLDNKLVSDFFKHLNRCKIIFFPHGEIIVTYHPGDKQIMKRLNNFYQAIATRMITTGSLSHGGGIMTDAIHTGLHNAGFDTQMVFAIEKEQKYLGSSLNNSSIWSGNSLAIEGLMEDVELNELDEVFLFEAGLPCTGASLSGRAKNGNKYAETHESAGRLFYSFLSQIQVTNPVIILLENVKQYKDTLSMHIIKDVLKSWGYQTSDSIQILNGHDEFGSIENRERMFFIAVSDGIDFDWDNVRNHRPETRYYTVGDILDPIPEASELWSEMTGLRKKQVRDFANNKGFMMQIVDESTTKTPVIGRGYSKIRSTEPKLAHPRSDLLRQFTVNEHARLKTIPEQLVAGNSKTTAHEILGQSVIYNVLKAIGQGIGDCLLNQSNKALNTA